MKEIYLDHAATTKLDERVLQKMMPYFTEYYGNANSQHGMGRDAQKAVDEARDEIAKLIGAQPNEIYFTSGGTEGDNWVLRGAAEARRFHHLHGDGLDARLFELLRGAVGQRGQLLAAVNGLAQERELLLHGLDLFFASHIWFLPVMNWLFKVRPARR